MPFSFFFFFSSRPGQVQRSVSKRPMSRITHMPVPNKKKSVLQPSFLEKGRFRKTNELITEIKKQSYYKNIPTYSRRPGQKERVKFIKDLVKISGASGGLSNVRLGQAIKKLEKEKMRAGYKKEYKRIKELDQQIKQAKAWHKTWLPPK